MTKKIDPNRLNWYVAYVKSCRERKAAEALDVLGIEYYLPVRREMRKWSDRRKIVEVLLIPRMIFVHCREAQRIRVKADVCHIWGFMSDGGPYNPTIVRDSDMDTFRAMVDRSDRKVAISSEPLVPGDRVRVVSGPLEGYECELVKVSDRRCLAVRLGNAGVATMDLALDDVIKVQS